MGVQNMSAVTIVKYVFTACGCGLLLGGWFWYQDSRSFVDSAMVTGGTVVSFDLSTSSKSRVYRPVVRFRDRQGKEIEFTSASGSYPPDYEEGDAVEVLYLPNKPHEAEISAWFPLWGGATILGGLGAVFSLIGLTLFAFGSRLEGEPR